MRTVTKEEVADSRDYVEGMDDDQTLALVEEMLHEQPFLQAYVAAVCERGDFDDESDLDAFANLSIVAWHAMRTVAGAPLVEVTDVEIEQQEKELEKLLAKVEGMTEENVAQMRTTWLEGYNQRPLLEFVMDLLISPDNEYDVTEEGCGLIIAYLRLIVECLDRVAIKRAK